MMKTIRCYRLMCWTVFTLTIGSLIACSDSSTIEINSQSDTDRWYSSSQASAGSSVFLENCAICHGENAEGFQSNWKEKLDDGSFPPPPLNGTAHTWHHPLSVLLQVINEGGQALGGKMPAFDAVLNDDEKLAVVAYFQEYWSDETYQTWREIDGGI